MSNDRLWKKKKLASGECVRNLTSNGTSCGVSKMKPPLPPPGHSATRREPTLPWPPPPPPKPPLGAQLPRLLLLEEQRPHRPLVAVPPRLLNPSSR